MPDYKQGKIYKIYNDEIPDKVYYGSTCNTLVKRLHKHKTGNKIEKTKCTSSVLFPGAKIVLVEKYPCNDKDELTKRERYYIENNECVNKCIPGRTNKEWRKNNKDAIKEKKKEYHLKNKQKIVEKNQKYRLENKQKIAEKGKEKIGCRICKCEIRKSEFKKHTKTKKHINNLN